MLSQNEKDDLGSGRRAMRGERVWTSNSRMERLPETSTKKTMWTEAHRLNWVGLRIFLWELRHSMWGIWEGRHQILNFTTFSIDCKPRASINHRNLKLCYVANVGFQKRIGRKEAKRKAPLPWEQNKPPLNFSSWKCTGILSFLWFSNSRKQK